MPRINRFEYIYDDCVVHIRVQINNGDFLFQDDRHFRIWRKWIKYYLQKYPSIKLTGYQWMNSHYHMILYVKKAADLPKFMHDINWRFAFEYNKLHKRKGHFFQSRYGCSVIEKDEYELIAQRYIYRNQIRAGMIRHIRHTRWGSYPFYAHGTPDDLITPFLNYNNFGRDISTRRKEFRLFVETMTDREQSEWKSRLKHPTLKHKKRIFEAGPPAAVSH